MLSRVIDISGCITAVIVRENRGEDKRCRLCIQLYKQWRPYPKGYYIVHNEQVPEAAVFFVCIFVGDTWAIHIEVCLNGSSESWEDLERSHQGWQIQLYQNRTHLPTNQRQQYQGKLYCNLENKAIFPPKPNVKKKKKKKEQNKPMPHLLPCENLLLLVCVCVYQFFFCPSVTVVSLSSCHDFVMQNMFEKTKNTIWMLFPPLFPHQYKCVPGSYSGSFDVALNPAWRW